MFFFIFPNSLSLTSDDRHFRAFPHDVALAFSMKETAAMPPIFLTVPPKMKPPPQKKVRHIWWGLDEQRRKSTPWFIHGVV